MNKLFINGQFFESDPKNTINIINPVTAEVIDTVILANKNDT